MKLLLTSNGLSTPRIAQALFELVGKPASETRVACIITAANIGESSRDWFIDDLENIRKQDFGFIDVLDISWQPREIWLSRLEKADVLFFSGGNTLYLMKWMKDSGLKDMLPQLLKTRVWAGISAGSIVTGPTLGLTSSDKKQRFEEFFGKIDNEGLGLVDFYFQSHYNNPEHPHRSRENVEKAALEVDGVVYALDDLSALKVVDGQVEIISDGEYLVLNQ